MFRRLNDLDGENKTLGNLELSYAAKKAFDLCAQSISIFRMLGSRKTECGGYGIFGEAYKKLGDNDWAADYYMQRARSAHN